MIERNWRIDYMGALAEANLGREGNRKRAEQLFALIDTLRAALLEVATITGVRAVIRNVRS